MKEFDGDVVEGGVGEVSGDVREVAGGVAELSVGHYEMDFGLVLHGVDDVGGAERNVKVGHVVLVEKSGFVRRNANAEDADVFIFEDKVVMRFLWDGDGSGSLGAEREREKKQEQAKSGLHF